MNIQHNLKQKLFFYKITSILLGISILSLFFTSCKGSKPDYSYCKLDEDEYYSILCSIESIQDDVSYYEDYTATLYCYFSGEPDVSFQDAKEAYFGLSPYLESMQEDLSGIHSTLKENFVDENDW